MNTDAVRLLTMAWEKSATGALPPEQFPPVYPALVASLIGAGLGQSVWLVLLNVAAIAAGLLAWRSIVLRYTGWGELGAQAGLLVFLLSWVTIKHAPIPLTEWTFFAVTNLSLLFLLRARYSLGLAGVLQWLAAVGLAFVAARTRTIGGVLLAVVTFTAFYDLLRSRAIAPPARRAAFAVGAGAGLLLLAFLLFLTVQDQAIPGSYTHFARASFRQQTLASLVGHHVAELGELAANLPLARFPRLLVPLFLLGALFAAMVVVGGWRWRVLLLPVVLYVFGSGAVTLVWPALDSRFWLPLLPWLLVLAGAGQPAVFQKLRLVFAAAAAAYVAFGLTALVHTARVTLSGADFPARYTVDSLRHSYEYAFGQTLHPAPDADPKAIRVLQHHDPRAAASAPLPR